MSIRCSERVVPNTSILPPALRKASRSLAIISWVSGVRSLALRAAKKTSDTPPAGGVLLERDMHVLMQVRRGGFRCRVLLRDAPERGVTRGKKMVMRGRKPDKRRSDVSGAKCECTMVQEHPTRICLALPVSASPRPGSRCHIGSWEGSSALSIGACSSFTGMRAEVRGAAPGLRDEAAICTPACGSSPDRAWAG